MFDKHTIQFLTIEDTEIAVSYKRRKNNPGFVYLNGYLSDMRGVKTTAISKLALELEVSNLFHDYFGHGSSKGDYLQGSISLWLRHSLTLFEYFTQGPQILIGSSLGGWIALLMAEKLKKTNVQLAGIILIAPATDFTQALLEPLLTSQQKQHLDTCGYFSVASQHGKRFFSKIMLDDSKKHLLMNHPITFGCPIHILHGMQDDSIPYQHSLKLMEHLPFDDVTLTLIKDGDHRLTRKQDLDFLRGSLQRLVSESNK